jgi:serine/threonine protein kinase
MIYGQSLEISSTSRCQLGELYPFNSCSNRLLIFLLEKSPYRAPELLFGTRTYDPLAIDLWSLGATFAQFFTALRSAERGNDDGDEDTEFDTDLEIAPTPFIVPKHLRISNPGAQWTRDSLFNGERGEIGLAWSIFKIFGTPTAESWPVSHIFHLSLYYHSKSIK